jgi:hypothetical protein
MLLDGNTLAEVGNCAEDTLLNVKDSFTFELCRSAANCWPKYLDFEAVVKALGKRSFPVVDDQTLDIDNGNTFFSIGEDLDFLIKPGVRCVVCNYTI